MTASTPHTQQNDAISAATDVEEPTDNMAAAAVTPPSSDSEDCCDDGDDSCGAGETSVGSDDVPDEFVCPLTFEVFDDPLMTRAGHNFERKAIVAWIMTGHVTCPLTRQPLSYRQLIPNANLRLRVERWKREHGYEVRADLESERRKERQFMFLVEPPPNSELEARWNRNLEAARQHGRRQREARNSQGTGLSPATQRRRLTGLLGVVRRASLTES
jgi:hypothetical protein